MMTREALTVPLFFYMRIWRDVPFYLSRGTTRPDGAGGAVGVQRKGVENTLIACVKRLASTTMEKGDGNIFQGKKKK